MFNQTTGTGSDKLDKTLEKLGYAYDANLKIFYSTLHAWQRNFGYCRLYDEGTVLLSMIMDCEPIEFEYRGIRWLIQFWKGQYALTTGCEVGVYKTDRPDINIPGVFRGPFYNAVGDDELFQLSFTLYRNGKMLFTREDQHWWLTGFILGEFSEPNDLTLSLSVTMKDEMILQAFVNGLKRVGYSDTEIILDGLEVSLLFAQPRTPQPLTRSPSTDWIIQRKNEMLCKMYQDITGQIETIPGKFEAIKKQAPRLYDQALRFGKIAQSFESYNILQHYLK